MARRWHLFFAGLRDQRLLVTSRSVFSRHPDDLAPTSSDLRSIQPIDRRIA
jgi:hypothetical protein